VAGKSARKNDQVSERVPAAPASGPTVTTILLNYNAPLETMLRCLESLERQDYQNLQVLLVDNASPADIMPRVAERHPGVEILRLDQNYGFSGGINRGVAHASGEYVFLLNFDTFLEPECVREMVAVLESHPGVVGVAPKMMLAGLPHIFDSVGTAVGDNAGAFNLAIGQPDVGQYDISERVFGACFGAALLRRQAFDDSEVGPLDEDYFMYFEDVDWCYRANLLGHGFLSAPRAVVYHEHSASVKDKSYDYKYKLIELNLLRTAVKVYQRRQAVKIPLRRLRTHLRNATSRDSNRRAVSWSIIADFLQDLPRLLPKRWEIQKRRQLRDLEVLSLSYGELPYYDPVAYAPIYDIGTLIATYRRLQVVRGDEDSLRIWRGLEALDASKLRFDEKVLRERLDQLLAGQPDFVRDFAARIAPAHA